MQRKLIFVLMFVAGIYAALFISVETQKNQDQWMLEKQRIDKLCEQLSGADGTAAGNLYNQLCKEK